MITKEELKEHYRLKQETVELEETIKKLQLQAQSVSATKITGAPAGSGSPDKIADNLSRIEKLIQYYQQKLEKLLIQQKQIEEAIESLPTNERLLMRYRYIDGLDWVDVAANMNYSWQWMHKIHARILKKLSGKDKEATQSD